MAKITKYTTAELENYRYRKKWLIEHWVHVGDCVFFKAMKKVGKSIIAQVLSFCASHGGKFLDEYDIPKPLKVAYLFSEGAVVDWKQRVINMKKMHKINEDNITWVQCQQLKIHTEMGGVELLEELKSHGIKYDIIVWDCFYKFLFCGDFNSNIHVGVFNANEEVIRNYFNAASIIIHHDSEKRGRGKNGKEYNMASINNAMGSTAILANATHSYTIEKHKIKDKWMNKIMLGDSRGGDLVTELSYYNVVPEDNDKGKLGITLDGKELNSNYQHIKDYVRENGKCKTRNLHKSIMEDKDMECSYETFRRAVNKMVGEKVVEKSVDDGVYYTNWVGN